MTLRIHTFYGMEIILYDVIDFHFDVGEMANNIMIKFIDGKTTEYNAVDSIKTIEDDRNGV